MQAVSKKEVHYKMLSSGVWLPAKPLLPSLQLRAFEASHHWVCLNCLGMRPRSPADVSFTGSALGQSRTQSARWSGRSRAGLYYVTDSEWVGSPCVLARATEVRSKQVWCINTKIIDIDSF